ncbi:hypothetical protein SAMN05444392_101725 [Seinonella peptonophila]|uniref:Uncharacterized protein n=1 Tax=Seinonella peptonophila TaxID=112248 RepID=A0A1M4TZT1_9BACL|nr:hypothetical protein [Seinonella peptonophila]SHE49847.1 hypothetical protein SAMN05444392_101725 [Seinonella peptonophila]
MKAIINLISGQTIEVKGKAAEELYHQIMYENKSFVTIQSNHLERLFPITQIKEIGIYR